MLDEKFYLTFNKNTQLTAMQIADKYVKEANELHKKREQLLIEGIVLKQDEEEFLELSAKEILCRARITSTQIFEMGRIIFEAKKAVEHGRFQEWLKHNVRFSRSTAANMMHVYQVCLGIPEIVNSFKPSILYKISEPSFPEKLRKLLFNNAKGVYDIKHEELVSTVLKLKSGEIDLDSPEVRGLINKQKSETHNYRLHLELQALIRSIQKHYNQVKTLSDIKGGEEMLHDDIDNDCDDELYSKILSKIMSFINDIRFEAECLQNESNKNISSDIVVGKTQFI